MADDKLNKGPGRDRKNGSNSGSGADKNTDKPDLADDMSSDIEDGDLSNLGSSKMMHNNDDGGMKDVMGDSQGSPKGKKGKSSDIDDGPFSKVKDDSKGSDDKRGNKKNDLMKKAIKAKAASSATGAGMAGYSAYKLIQFLKLMLAKGIQMIQSLIATIVNAVMGLVNTLATVLSVSVTIAASILTGGVISILSVVVVGVSTIITTNTARNDAISSACVPSTVTYEDEDLDETNNGESSQKQLEIAQKIWSVFKKAGASTSVTAAVLGNFQIESGIDPTTVETIYTEPYTWGEKKKYADSVDYLVANILPSYAAQYPLIHRVGIGLGQWTDTNDGATGNSQLRAYAKKIGKPWYTIDAQLAFMFSEPDGQKAKALKFLISGDGKNYSVNEATEHFLIYWEGNPNNKLAMRQEAAGQWAIRLKEMDTDDAYAESILSDANISQGDTNNATGEYNKSDGCDDTVGDHYSGGEPDGTGEVPSDLSGWAWTPDTLPDSLKKYAHDPKSVGLGYNNSANWFENSGQCVDFSNSYMSVLYSKKKMTIGNGRDTAYRWADEYGGTVSKTPQAGAVFSCLNSGQYGHTGVVEHVFANGDILVVEQNVGGYSGANNGQSNSWSWRIISKSEWSRSSGTSASWGWVFFKPSETPKWDSAK